MTQRIPITEEAIKDYLDKAIVYWASINNNHYDAETKTVAKHYTDAIQSIRAALLGSTLKGYELDSNATYNPASNSVEVEALLKGAVESARSSVLNLVRHPSLIHYGLMGIGICEWVALVKGIVLMKAPHLKDTISQLPSKGTVTGEEIDQVTKVLFSVIGTPEDIYRQINEER